MKKDINKLMNLFTIIWHHLIVFEFRLKLKSFFKLTLNHVLKDISFNSSFNLIEIYVFSLTLRKN